MKIQRLSAITVNERTVSGLQLTRVVPPSFSVPFAGSAGGLAFFCFQQDALFVKYKAGQGLRENV